MATSEEVDLDRPPSGNVETTKQEVAHAGVGTRWPWRRDHPSVLGGRQQASYVELSPVWEATEVTVSGSPTAVSRDSLYRRMLAGADVAAAGGALLAVLQLGSKPIMLRPAVAIIVPFIVLASKVLGLYDRDQHLLRKTTIDEAPQILYLSVLYALLAWLCEGFMLRGWLARSQVFELTLLSFAFILAGRWTARNLARAVSPAEICLVLGDSLAATRIAAKLEQAVAVGARVIGRISLRTDEDDRPGGLAHLGHYRSLVKILAEHRVERVIIAPESDGGEEILDAIRIIKALGIKVSVLPRLLEVVGSSSSFDDIEGMGLLGVRHDGMSKSSAFLKRTMDIVGATLVLVVLAPLMLTLTLAVKLTSRGPVFFRQPRVGRRGERFAMLKFRSMVDGAERLKHSLIELNEAEGGLFKIRDDPRVTPVGRLLRRSALDELPQLFNVLRGDMSLVGPRPLVPDEDALIEGWQRRRLTVRPGMTGLWQIFGSARIPMQEMVKIDYLYGANWSLWLDLKILIRTIPYVLGRRGL